MEKFTPEQIAVLEHGTLDAATTLLLDNAADLWAEAITDIDGAELLRRFHSLKAVVRDTLHQFTLDQADICQSRIELLLIHMAVSCAPMFRKAIVEMEKEKTKP